uniref:NADH-ubiquinone oxidoreductase chain 2 n=1 Tax=Sarcoptes scabiei TaxID=52283 RepID=A0A343ISV5_SARSC|nr:NADH dehydrogenase subunit 2 [Sarcoptes scabiei]AST11037.1 NADH dehydrogenase subunit 2 [Sarcoptes scabiei]AST11089.1 NADH dehydrogenase subunit 2 [Sarcoptes scabiei]AST11167.1 NADH dehydrogenase subunit 2 [Sarcoptes scabiei]
MMFFLFLSSLFCISSSSFIMMWFLMEINTMFFLSLLTKNNKNKKMSIKNSFNYFIIQIISSVFFLISFFILDNFLSILIFNFSMTMKMGVWPFHFWYLKMLYFIDISYIMFLFMTWQKIIPLFMMFYNLKNFFLLLMMSFFSFLVSGFMLNKYNNFKSTIIFSSLNNNGWFLLSIFCSLKIFLFYFFMYSYSLMIFFYVLKFENLKMKNFIFKENENMFVYFNLLGTPFSPMFFSKMLIIMGIMEFMNSKEIMIFFIIMSFFFVFFYTLSSYKYVINIFLKNQYFFFNTKDFFLFFLSYFLFFMMFFLM